MQKIWKSFIIIQSFRNKGNTLIFGLFQVYNKDKEIKFSERRIGMKKLLLAASILAVTCGAGSASAFGGIMDVDAGYGYSNAADGIHSAHIEVKPVPKLAIGAEYRHWNNRGNETDVYAKYKIGKLYVGAGNRNYYDRDAKMYGLIEGRTNLIGPLDAYAGLLVSSAERQYKAGLQVDLVPTSFDVDVNYTYYDRDDVENEKGVGIGLNYHF